jgi:spore coat protein YsxE
MLREAARLHALSAKEIDVSKEEREEHYERMYNRWEQQEEQLEQFLQLAEAEIYMSPFQLLFCLYYYEISQSFIYAKERLKTWKEETKEDKKTRTVRIHGNLATDHFIMDEKGAGYFINLEQSRQATPLHDLIPYFTHSLKTFPKNTDADLNNLLYYMQFFPLKKGEKLLLQSYFAYPGAIFQTIFSYFTEPGTFSEQRFTEKLQRQYWQMKNVEYMITKLPEDKTE